jgi:hypothetical protein
LIDKFKEEIGNLTLVGMGSEHAQQIFSSPYSFTALTYSVSNIDARMPVVMQNSLKKPTLDSVLATIKSLHTDSLWVKKMLMELIQTASLYCYQIFKRLVLMLLTWL